MIRDAILKAADQIEREPSSWNFSSLELPDCGTPGCAIGWIAAFAKLPSFGAADRFLGVDNSGFYRRMDVVCRERFGDCLWTSIPERVPTLLRGYADAYHPAEHSTKHHGIPESVRELFEVAA